MHNFRLLLIVLPLWSAFFFFFNDPATTEIYTLSLHDALPIFDAHLLSLLEAIQSLSDLANVFAGPVEDRKSTRLNSSHQIISYAVFCLKKKKKKTDSMNALF